MRRVSMLLLMLTLLSTVSGQEVDPNRALFEATRQQNTAGVKDLLESGADPNWSDPEQMDATPLMMAAARDNAEIGRLLLLAGARIDSVDTNGDPAINWAAYYGYTDFVAMLLDRGASTDLVGHGAALDIAMRRGHQDLVLMLARHNGTAPELDSATLAMQQAIDAGDYAALQAALESGASASTLDDTGRPMLARASRQGKVWLASLLLDSGADIDAEDSIGYTALMESAREGHGESVEMLLSQGADPGHRAKPRGLSFTPLHLAAIGGDPDVLAMLIAEGVNLDTPDSMQAPAALWALFEEQSQACLTLLQAGADYQQKSDSGYSVASAAEEMQVAVVTDWILQNSQDG